jgi:molybdate transport system substrate-binding protein
VSWWRVGERIAMVSCRVENRRRRVKSFQRHGLAIVVAITLLLVRPAAAAEIRVMTSGAFTAAYLALMPRCADARGDSAVTVTTTMGAGETSIPNRLERREAADVVIVDREALGRLLQRGLVSGGSRVDLARSAIGVAVKAGTTRPDISTVDAFRRALLSAASIAYSASVSGDYLSTDVFQRLGIADVILPRSRRIVGERVGSVVARGDAALGFQQISELLPITGLDYVGPLPIELQKVTVFAAGVVGASPEPERARAFIACLASSEAAATIAASGLEPRHGVAALRPEFRDLAQVGPFLER